MNIMDLIAEHLNEYLKSFRFEGERCVIEFFEGESLRIPFLFVFAPRPSNIYNFIEYARRRFHSVIFFSDYFSPSVQKILRDCEIWYADSAGNIYINIENRFLLHISGKKQKGILKIPGIITSKSARVLLYLIFQGPEMSINYREISQFTGVSLGRLSGIFAYLKKYRIIEIKNSRCYIINPAMLLDYWIRSYTEKLKPSHLLGKFVWERGKDFHRILKDGIQFLDEIYAGGEFGAELATGYITSATAEFWIPEDKYLLLQKRMKLMHHSKGYISIYKMFPGMPFLSFPNVASPPMLYADLLQIGDSRCIETAKIIREKYLKWTL